MNLYGSVEFEKSNVWNVTINFLNSSKSSILTLDGKNLENLRIISFRNSDNKNTLLYHNLRIRLLQGSTIKLIICKIYTIKVTVWWPLWLLIVIMFWLCTLEIRTPPMILAIKSPVAPIILHPTHLSQITLISGNFTAQNTDRVHMSLSVHIRNAMML